MRVVRVGGIRYFITFTIKCYDIYFYITNYVHATFRLLSCHRFYNIYFFKNSNSNSISITLIINIMGGGGVHNITLHYGCSTALHMAIPPST